MSVENKRELLDKSLEQGIIDKAEYKKEKEKLDVLEAAEQESAPKEKPVKEKLPEQKSAKKDSLETKEPTSQEKETSEPTPEPKVEIVDEPAEKTKKVDIVEEKHESSLTPWLWIAGIIAIIFALSFCSIQQEEPESPAVTGEITELPITDQTQELQPQCSTDEDCAQPQTWYYCDSADGQCVVELAKPVEATLLVDSTCPDCSTARVQSILTQWFPAVMFTEVAADSIEGKTLIAQHGITVFPIALLSTDASTTKLWSKVSGAFRESDGSYVMKESAAGSSWYGVRTEDKEFIRLVIVDDETGKRALANTKEIVDALNAEFRLVVNDNSCSAQSSVDAMNSAHCELSGGANCDTITLIDCTASSLSEELGVNSVPYMLINNKLRVDGVQSAESIKEQYCSLNNHSNCDVKLKSYLV